jgi:hypothetical protein
MGCSHRLWYLSFRCKMVRFIVEFWIWIDGCFNNKPHL